MTEYDYDNMLYISNHAHILNELMKTYSTLDTVYPQFSYDDIRDISPSFVLSCSFDI
ncbi:MAG: hypothetical protein WCL02_04335 [bacterium]